MRKIFKKVMAGAMTTVMVASLFVGVSVTSSTVKAEEADVSSAMTPWVVYSAGQITRSVDPDGWPVRYYSSFTTTAGETKSDWDANFPNKQYVDGGEETWTTTKVANGFTANIANTGWDGQYEGSTLTGDNPYMLKATMPSIKLKEGYFYKISMDLAWTNKKDAPEKNVQVLVNDSFTNNLDSQRVTIKSGSSVHFETQMRDDGKSKVATYGTDTLEIVLAMGAFLHSYNNSLTTENVAAEGTLKVENLKIIELGKDEGYIPAPPPATTEPSTPDKPGVTTPTNPDKPGVTTPTKVTAKKLAKVKKLKAVSKKKGTVKITWKKVKNAKKYQVKVGKKTYNTKKVKLTVKKVKKGKVVVKVRAKAAGYKTSAWATKKVKVK